jgi:hypothetical protein
MNVLQQLRRLCCRHEDILRIEKNRIWLECLACGRSTPGFAGLGRAVRAADVAHGIAHTHWHPRAIDRAA